MSIVCVVWYSVLLLHFFCVFRCCCFIFWSYQEFSTLHCNWLRPPCLNNFLACSFSPGLASAPEDQATSSCHLTFCQASTEYTCTHAHTWLEHLRRRWERKKQCGSCPEIKMHHKTEMKTNEKWFLLMRKLFPVPERIYLLVVVVGQTCAANACWKQSTFVL